MDHAENAEKNKTQRTQEKKLRKHQNIKLFTIYKYLSKNFKQTLNPVVIISELKPFNKDISINNLLILIFQSCYIHKY